MSLDTDVYQRVVAAKMFIDDNHHEAIALDDISQRACFSPFHFHRLFTRIYRKTPHQYLTSVRLEAAKNLLKEDGITISEVCNSVGFESLGSFSLLFKKQSGFTPQYFRNLALLRKKAAQQQPRSFIPHCFITMRGGK